MVAELEAAQGGFKFHRPEGLSAPEASQFTEAMRKARKAAYKADARSRRRKLTLNDLRINELRRIAMHRWPDAFGGFSIPEDAVGEALVQAMMTHMRGRPGNNMPEMFRFCEVSCIWFDPHSVDLEAPVQSLRADELGAALQLTEVERRKLAIRTIGAVGVDRAQRAENRKASHRLREQARREAKGAKPRSKSLSRLETWTTEGMTRSTWYRQRKAMRTLLVAQIRVFATRRHETDS